MCPASVSPVPIPTICIYNIHLLVNKVHVVHEHLFPLVTWHWPDKVLPFSAGLLREFVLVHRDVARKLCFSRRLGLRLSVRDLGELQGAGRLSGGSQGPISF